MLGHGKSKAAASRASKKSRSVRAGFQFPVGRIHRIIRHAGDLKQEVNNPGEQNPETHLIPAEIAAVKAQALTKVKEGNFKHIASELDVNQPTLPHGLGSIFVTPPNILKQQLTGYCTSPASSPIGRDNKHGWYEEHEKFVAITTRSLSSVLLVGDSLVNGLARYHRVWSKYLEPLRALNFGVGGDRTQHVLWRIENGEIPLNLQVAFVRCGTNNLDRDNPAEIKDGIASIVYTIQEKKPNASINSKREHPPGQPPGFCTYFQPGSQGFVPSELPRGCPGVGPIIKVPSCQLMPHEGTFQLQTDLPSIATL